MPTTPRRTTKHFYARTSSLAALVAGLVGTIAAMPAAGQTARFRPLVLPSPTPTPAASPSPAASPAPAPVRRIVLPTRGAAMPAPAPTLAPTATPAPIPGGRFIRPRVPTPERPAPQQTPTQTAARPATPSGPLVAPRITPSLASNFAQIDVTPAVQKLTSAKAVTLKANSYGDLLKSVSVVRKVSLQQLRANPRLMLGKLKIDLTPVLTRPGGLPSVAQKLQATASLGRVNTQDVEVNEIAQGLVIRSFLNYQLKPGACSDSRRGQVEAIGLRCSARMTSQQRAAAFATPGNARYIADPQRRAATLARAEQDTQREAAEIATEVANFRAALAAPATRQQIEAEIGAAEAQRLSVLSDDDLARELIDAGENKVEQVFYVPKPDTVDPIDKGRLALLLNPPPPAPPAPPPKPKPVTTDTPLDTTIYLTGFTLGKSYEWSERVETSISWCLIGCTKHYHAHVFAHFSYGFGLRFPISLGGTYHYQTADANRPDAPENATYTAEFHPINGGPDDYAATGLAADKIFAGKEFVAEVSAGAGFDAHIPIYPDPPTLAFDASQDFTELLPSPFYKGQFQPPAAGQDSAKAKYIFDKYDLLAGRLNFGILGAMVFPGVELGLHSDKLTFDLYDDVNKVWVKPIKTGQIVPVGVKPGAHSSSFTISNPVYNVGFVITPGIDARLFIDLGVWSHNWDFPLWFPQLTIELPPGGQDFACHDGTHCEHTFQFATIGGQTVAGPEGQMVADIEAWGPAFDTNWLPRCLDETCKVTVRLARVGTVLKVEQMIAAIDFKAATPKQLADAKQQVAIVEAKGNVIADKAVNESIVRDTAKTVDAIAVLAKAVWAKQCKDQDCLPEIDAIAAKMTPRGKQVQAQDLNRSATEVLGIVGKEFAPQFQAAVDRSEARFGVQSIGELAKAVWSKQCLDDLCRTQVTLLAAKMLTKAVALQKATPDMSGLELSGAVGKEFGPLFKKEVEASKLRAKLGPIAPVTPRGWKPGDFKPAAGSHP